jgi:hypothetical protein
VSVAYLVAVVLGLCILWLERRFVLAVRALKSELLDMHLKWERLSSELASRQPALDIDAEWKRWQEKGGRS